MHYHLPLNKPCELEDFSNPELLDVMRRVFAQEIRHYHADWPEGMEYRKYWEIAMAVRAIEQYGLPENGLALGVGAGTEPTTFYLTNLFRWVFATDLYLLPGEWTETAPPLMLTDPGKVAPTEMPFNARRLVVQHMDGRDLRFEDNSFDVIFSSSSIEHFGDWDDVVRAASEMGRVLKPGGLLTLATEYRIGGSSTERGVPNVLMFQFDDLRKLIIEPSGCVPIDEPQSSTSLATRRTAIPWAEVQVDQERMRRIGGNWSRYPHLSFTLNDFSWTSYHLALRKPI